MKVLIATPLYPPEIGGPSTYAKLLEDKLPERGIAISILSFHTVRQLPRGIRHVVYFWKCFLQALTADVVYAQDVASVGFPAALAALFARRKFMVRVPGDYAWEQGCQRFGVADELDVFQQKKYGWRVEFLRRVQQFVVSRATAIVVPSNYMKSIVGRWTDTKKVHVIYSSISLPATFELPPSRPEGFLLVAVARLVPWKCMDGIVRVLARKPHWQLVIVGDGPELKKLEDIVQSLGLGERVQFMGALPRARALGWVKTADVFVLNSTYEGLSYLLIEAMSLGTAVVVTNVGGNPEVIKTGVNGILVQPHDDEELLHAIEKIENYPDQAKKFADVGVGRIAQNFSAETAITALIQLLSVKKVLMISGDRRIFEVESDASRRLELQRSTVEKLDVFVCLSPHSVLGILRAVWNEQYDVVTTQDPFWRGLVGVFASWVGSARLNVQVHADLRGQSWFRRVLAEFSVRHADSVRVVSDKLRGQVLALGVHASVKILPVFVDIEPFRVLTRTPHAQKTILWIGRFEVEKDPLYAIQVLEKVLLSCLDTKLIMLGTGGREEELRQRAKCLPIEFPGWKDSKLYLPEVDVVLCTSPYESWGASIVEALAAGVPVVSCDVGVALSAGAHVTDRNNLAKKVVEVLESGVRGELKITLPTAKEWAVQWKETL